MQEQDYFVGVWEHTKLSQEQIIFSALYNLFKEHENILISHIMWKPSPQIYTNKKRQLVKQNILLP